MLKPYLNMGSAFESFQSFKILPLFVFSYPQNMVLLSAFIILRKIHVSNLYVEYPQQFGIPVVICETG